MANLSFWKDSVGFGVYTKDDPDLLSWLYVQWVKKESPDEATSASVIKFLEFSSNLISQKPVVAMEYIDNGIAVILSTGEKIPFNKSSTVKQLVTSVNVMGASTSMAGPRVDPQVDTSIPITGEAR
jgi:hypothetical protein